jgi:hypothetical protein
MLDPAETSLKYSPAKGKHFYVLHAKYPIEKTVVYNPTIC